jgi:lysozyme
MQDIVADLSHHNGLHLDFVKAKAAGIQGIIHKATAGLSWTDPMYVTNRMKAIDAGLLWGAYHWGVGDADPQAQLDHFLSFVKPDNSTLLALDYEPNVAGAHRLGPDMTPSQAVQFATLCEGQLGSWPTLYTGLAMAGHFPNLPDCPLWWAGYSSSPHGIPTTWAAPTLWQYTSHGLVDGIGYCDRDEFYGDDLEAFWKASPMAGVTGSAEGEQT